MLVTTLLFFFAAIARSVHSIDESDIQMLRRAAEFSAAAYCPDNYLASPANGSICPGYVCPDLPGLLRAHAFGGPGEPYGILTLDHHQRQIVISFRGTMSEEDWETNIDFVLDDASNICPDCYAHKGFLTSWMGGRESILAWWKLLQDRYPHYTVLSTGHSLGGALATFCALEIAAELQTNNTCGTDVRLVTYGVPRVGNDALASFTQNTLRGNSYRVTHLNDPVPRLPGRVLGFSHPYPEYHITSPHIPNVLEANETVLTSPRNLRVEPEDLLVLSRNESDRGNTGYNCSNINMHDAYFVDIRLAEGICGVLDICCGGSSSLFDRSVTVA